MIRPFVLTVALAALCAPLAAVAQDDDGQGGAGWVLTAPERQSPEARCRYSAESAANYAMNQLQLYDVEITISLKDAETSCTLKMADLARTVDFKGQTD